MDLVTGILNRAMEEGTPTSIQSRILVAIELFCYIIIYTLCIYFIVGCLIWIILGIEILNSMNSHEKSNFENASKGTMVDDATFSVNQTWITIQESICTKPKRVFSINNDSDMPDLPYFFCVLVETFVDRGNRTNSSWRCIQPGGGKTHLLNIYENGLNDNL